MKREYWGDEEKHDKEIEELQDEDSSEDDEVEGEHSEAEESREGSQSDDEFRQFKKAKIEELYGEDVATEAFKIEEAIKEAIGEGQSESEDNEDDGIAEIDEVEMENARVAEQKRQNEIVKNVDFILDETLLWAVKSIWKVMEGRRNNDETVQQTLQRLNLERKKKTKRKDRKRSLQDKISITERNPAKIIDLNNSTLDEQIAVVVDAVDILEKNRNFEDILDWTRNEVFESRGFIKSYNRSQDSTW